MIRHTDELDNSALSVKKDPPSSENNAAETGNLNASPPAGSPMHHLTPEQVPQTHLSATPPTLPLRLNSEEP